MPAGLPVRRANVRKDMSKLSIIKGKYINKENIIYAASIAFGNNFCKNKNSWVTTLQYCYY